MNADHHDNMVRIEAIGLDDWKQTVSPHQAWLWCNDLIRVIRQSHFQLDRANVAFGDGDLPQRIELLRERMEDAEDRRDELTETQHHPGVDE